MVPLAGVGGVVMWLAPGRTSDRQRAAAPPLCLAALLRAGAMAAAAADEIDRQAMMRRPAVVWSQAEREFGFGHWDELYPSRLIARGPSVRALPRGAPLAGFAPGEAGALQLQRNVDEFRLAGIVVLHRGQLRLEHYAHGYGADGRWVSFSLAKSLTSTLLGAAIRDGFIGSVDDAVTRYIPELQGSVYDGVTLQQLLTMSSGVKWNEDYNDPAADVALFYMTPFAPGSDPTVSYMKTLRREAPPGTRWHYNTGETNLIGVVVSRATRRSLASYASETIWAPYGMESDASWMLDRSGHEHGGCCIQARTRDYARFGQFMLDGGRVEGRPILPEGWLQTATRKQVDIGRPGFGYGYQWWARDNGSFNAIGIHGQVIHVDPARGLVVAMNSATPEANASPASMQARVALFDAIRAAVDSEHRAGPGPR
jgi:CubicO group peptidase (beta-lactamase class C family)